jgi:hypothetical protein
MKPCFCGLLALGLFLRMAGQGQSQPTYAFSTLDVPGYSEGCTHFVDGEDTPAEGLRISRTPE